MSEEQKQDQSVAQVISFATMKPPVPGLKLNIGSGDHITEGFINVDKYNPLAEANWDAGHLQLNDNTVALIVCVQTFEHFGYHEALPIIREWYRVLKPGGQAHIVTPDIMESFKRVLDHPDVEWNLARVFGNQTHEGQFHKWGYTAEKLVDLFAFAGFTYTIWGKCAINPQDEQLYVVGTK